MNITAEQLKAVMGVSDQSWVDAINETLAKYDISTKQRVAAFLAQIGHESGCLKFTVENLNYSADALVRVFSKYFDKTSAWRYARQPAAIASRVYAGRMGNGGEASGDGFRYRGRGVLQVTGKNNYAACSKALGYDFLADPDALGKAPWAVLSAGWFWDNNGLNAYCDKNDFVGLTKRINGGTNGLVDRQMLYSKALAAL